MGTHRFALDSLSQVRVGHDDGLACLLLVSVCCVGSGG